MSVKASDIKLEIQRMPVTRKKMKNTAKLKASVTQGAQAPNTMHKHHIRCTSTKHDARGITYDAEASNTMHKHQDDAQAPKNVPYKSIWPKPWTNDLP